MTVNTTFGLTISTKTLISGFLLIVVIAGIKSQQMFDGENELHKFKAKERQTSVNLHYQSVNTTLLERVLVRRDAENDQILSNLIEFLMGESTGRNFYFFFNYGHTAISASAAACCERGAEVTTFECEEGVNYLENIIRSFNQLESIRNMIVLCSSEVTKALFKEIREKYLESALTHWFVILYEDILHELTNLMREGTQVTFSLKVEPSKYAFLGSYININNTVALHDLGWWSWDASSGVKKLLRKPLYRPVLEVYSDFGGRELIVTVIDNWPFWILTYPGDGRVIPTSGLDYNVLKTIGDKLNFTFRMEITPDGKWGGVMADGTVTGMVGVVHRHEAHAAINEFTLTEQREQAIDFTKPYYYESTTLISPAPTKQIRTFAILTSFTSEVWIAFLLVMIAISPLVNLLVRFRKRAYGEENQEWENLVEVYFNMYRHLMIQGSEVPSSKLVYRMFFITWFYFCFLITSLYADVMIAVLAVPSYEKPIDSLYDLLEVIKKKGYVTVLGCGSNNEFIYSNTDMKIYRDIYEWFDHSKGCIKDWDDGMDRVLSGKYVFSNNRLGAEVRANLRGRSKFHFAANEFYAHGYSIACPSGSPYKTAFEEVLVKELSYGLVQKYSQDELDKARKPEESGDRGPEPIGVQRLQAAFFMVALLNTLAIVILFVERIVHKSKGKNGSK